MRTGVRRPQLFRNGDNLDRERQRRLHCAVMALTPDEWDAGEENLRLAALFVLKERAPLALTLMEIRVELGHYDRFPEVAELEEALTGLMTRIGVQVKSIQGTVYYRYERKLGFRPPER
jgi:hypothetical protein